MYTYQHIYQQTITFTWIENTNKGMKGILRDTAGSKKDREGKVAYFSDSEMKQLFKKIENNI